MENHSSSNIIRIRDYSCFKKNYITLPQLKPITLIIGQNNAGKSHYMRMLKAFSVKNYSTSVKDLDFPEIEITTSDTVYVINSKKPNTQSQRLGNKEIACQVITKKQLAPNQITEEIDSLDIQQDIRDKKIADCLLEDAPFRKFTTITIDTERDIKPELCNDKNLKIDDKGNKITAFIQNYLNEASNKDKVLKLEKELINQLNDIIKPANFITQISNKKIDQNNHEIHFKTNSNVWISLSDCGSSVKTVFFILLNVLLIPDERNIDLKKFIYFFEEIDNSLHPSAIKRLMAFIEESASAEGPYFFLTSHSAVTLDFVSQNEQNQIINIRQDAESSYADSILMESEQLSVLRDLGNKPSDLLQANGIIWVEGPSDRIYLNKWIDLWSDGKLKEGRHYQCLFYGGSVLSNFEAQENSEDSSSLDDLINLIKVNSNVILISDSDKTKDDDKLKERVSRVRKEFEHLPEHCWHWVMAAKEIENYLTGELMNEAITIDNQITTSPQQFEQFFSKSTPDGQSYLEQNCKRNGIQKTELARKTVPHMQKDSLQDRFDLDESMKRIVELIEHWNS